MIHNVSQMYVFDRHAVWLDFIQLFNYIFTEW